MSYITEQRPQGHYQSDASEPMFKNANTTVQTTETEATDSSANSIDKEAWKPGYMEQFPWLGFGGLLGVLICSAICVMLVYISNGKAKSEWKSLAPPNVLISIFTSVASILVTMAVGQGIAISWWRKAMKGATVEDLHQSWSFGSSITSIITGYKFFNVMALTALCTKFAIIDSTLYQKALTTTIALGPPRNISIGTYSFETFPPTGRLNSFGNDTAETNFAMSYDQVYWLQSDTYTGISWDSYIVGDQLSGCEGLCALTYRGVGFASSCSLPSNISYASRSQKAVAAGNNSLLDIGFTYQKPNSQRNYSYIQMDWRVWSSYSGSVYDNGTTIPNTNCNGDFYHMQCELRPAIIDYPIVLQNSSFSGRSAKGGKTNTYTVYIGTMNETDGYYDGPQYIDNYWTDQQTTNVSVVRYLDVTENTVPGGNSSLGGIVTALNTYYKSQSVATYQRINSTSTSNSSSAFQPVSQNSGLQISFAQLDNYNDGCPTGFTDPFYRSTSLIYYDDMLANINQLTLLISTDPYIQADFSGGWGSAYDENGTETAYFTSYMAKHIQNVDSVALKPETYFYSKFGFAWGAFATTIIVVALILPSYWGYWQLGRKVTLGPLEIANAFDAPAFAHVNRKTGHVEHVLEAVGKQKVKYDTNGRYGFIHH